MSQSPRTKKFISISAILAVLGIVVSVYATMHHLELRAKGVTDAACNISEQLSCDSIAASKYSELMGVPIGVYGIGFFLGLLTLLGLALFKPEQEKDALQTLAAMVGIGIVVSLVLAGISLFLIGVGCPTCIAIYVIVAALAINLAIFRSEIPSPWAFKYLSNGSTYAILALAVAIGIFKLLPRPQTDPNGHASSGNDHVHGDDDHVHSEAGGEIPILSKTMNDIKIDKSDFSGHGQDYRAGSDDAKVTVIEFADFQCPACRSASMAVKQLKEAYGEKVLVVFKNYPLDNSCNDSVQRRLHDQACNAAILARCAGQQGKFWQMHDLIFTNQQQISHEKLRSWAKSLGLSDEQIQECEKSNAILAKIKDDIKQGNELGITSTPTLYVNGQQVIGDRSYAALKREVDKRLNE